MKITTENREPSGITTPTGRDCPEVNSITKVLKANNTFKGRPRRHFGPPMLMGRPCVTPKALLKLPPRTNNKARKLESLKERVGELKYNSIMYNIKNKKHEKPRKVTTIEDLTNSISKLKTSSFKDYSKEVNAILKVKYKKIEREKEFFKEQRWKRAQDAEELLPVIISAKTRETKEDVKITIDVAPAMIEPLLERAVLLNGFNLPLANYQSLINAFISDIEAYNKYEPEPSLPNRILDSSDEYMRSLFSKIQCPYCDTFSKCKVCIMDDPNAQFGVHQMRVIEDIAIAFINIYTYFDIQTFVFEFIRIIKTMFGISLVKFDYMKAIPYILGPILKLCQFTKDKYNDLTENFDLWKLVEFIQKLFESAKNKLKPAQDDSERDLGGKPTTDFGLQDTLLSDWLDTDLFKFISNWFCYMCYLTVSKGECTDLPFLGDLMRSTIDYGKTTSKDILRYAIKTVEFIVSKGKLCMKLGFITTFYHNKNTLSTIRSRFDRLCEQFLGRVNPKMWNIDVTKFRTEMHAMRKELTDLSRVGTLKVREEINKMLTRVIIMDNDLNCDENIYRNRKAPFTLLIWGKTSIGKSTFLDLNIKLNCDVHGYEYTPSKIYTMNRGERLDGYKSDMHSIIIDDIGNKNPRVCPTGDPMVHSIIELVNNVAAITEQAAVEDKGKIPIQSDFIYGTANCEHINSLYYMSYPAAVMRRFSAIIELRLKPEFAESGMFCHNKPNVDYSTFDFWDIYIGKYVPNQSDNSTGMVVYDAKPITNISDYYVWLAQASKAHFVQQTERMDSLSKFAKLKFCRNGHLSKNCKCEDFDKLPFAEPRDVMSSGELFSHGEYILNKKNEIVLAAQDDFECLPPNIFFGSHALAALKSYNLPTKLMTLSCGGVYHFCEIFKNLSLYSARTNNWFGTRAYAMKSSIEFANKMSALKNEGASELELMFKGAAELFFPDEDTTTQFVLKLSATLGALYLGYKVGKLMFGSKEEVKEPQGALLVKNKSEFWVDNSNVLKDVDVGASSMFYKNKIDEFLDVVARNTVMLRCQLKSNAFINIRALCIGGWCYVTNAHYLSGRDFDSLEIIQDSALSASSNLRIKYDFSNVIIQKNKDLVYFYLKDNKPKKNILNLFYRGNVDDSVFDGCYIARNLNGSITQIPIVSIKRSADGIIFRDKTTLRLNTFSGVGQVPTKEGDCGMPLIAFTHFGPTILGLHVTGIDNSISATRLSVSDITSTNMDLRPDLGGMKMTFSSSYKTLIPERLVSHPLFLPSSGSLIRYGSIKQGGARCKSHVERTEMAPKLEAYGYEQLKDVPPMNHWKIYRKNLEELTDKESLADQSIIDECVDLYVDKLVTEIPQSEFDQMGVLSDEANINGVPGVDYIDKINRNTSAGFPWCKSKKSFLYPCSNEDHPDGVAFDDEIMDEFRRKDYIARTGCMSHPVYNASQKDEPLPKQKCIDYGTRLFFGAPVPDVMIGRKYHLSQVAFFQRNRLATRCAIGTVVQSHQWGEIADALKWKNRIIAGDYKKFDKKQQIKILHGAFDILDKLARKSKQYSDIDLNAMLSYRCDTVYALVHFDGDLLAFFGSLPSGNPLTTLLNCLCNILLDMYAYKTAGNDLKTYFKLVFTFVYGDDSITSVSPECRNFNHTIKQRELDKIGIKFTMAEKDRESVPFITLSEATFLKRKFVFHDDIGYWMAPLEEDNIVNSLMVWVKSKNLTPVEQAYATLQNSVREFFFHGKKKFEEMVTVYQNVYNETYLKDIVFPSYDDILESFKSYEFKPAQGSRPTKPRSCEDDVRLVLRCKNLPPEMRRIILSYVGYCMVTVCKEFRKDKLLCSKHDKTFKRNLFAWRHAPSIVFCHACGNTAWSQTEYLDVSLCLECMFIYACYRCQPDGLCIEHESWPAILKYRISTHSLQILGTTIKRVDRIYDVRKDDYFKNYHLSLGT